MSNYAKLDARVILLERHMPEVRKLASDASKEVGDVRAQYRAHTQVLEALRQTQLDHYAEMQQGFTEMRQGFAEMRTGFATMNVGMELITMRLGIEEWESGES